MEINVPNINNNSDNNISISNNINQDMEINVQNINNNPDNDISMSNNNNMNQFSYTSKLYEFFNLQKINVLLTTSELHNNCIFELVEHKNSYQRLLQIINVSHNNQQFEILIFTDYRDNMLQFQFTDDKFNFINKNEIYNISDFNAKLNTLQFYETSVYESFCLFIKSNIKNIMINNKISTMTFKIFQTYEGTEYIYYNIPLDIYNCNYNEKYNKLCSQHKHCVNKFKYNHKIFNKLKLENDLQIKCKNISKNEIITFITGKCITFNDILKHWSENCDSNCKQWFCFYDYKGNHYGKWDNTLWITGNTSSQFNLIDKCLFYGINGNTNRADVIINNVHQIAIKASQDIKNQTLTINMAQNLIIKTPFDFENNVFQQRMKQYTMNIISKWKNYKTTKPPKQEITTILEPHQLEPIEKEFINLMTSYNKMLEYFNSLNNQNRFRFFNKLSKFESVQKTIQKM